MLHTLGFESIQGGAGTVFDKTLNPRLEAFEAIGEELAKKMGEDLTLCWVGFEDSAPLVIAFTMSSSFPSVINYLAGFHTC